MTTLDTCGHRGVSSGYQQRPSRVSRAIRRLADGLDAWAWRRARRRSVRKAARELRRLDTRTLHDIGVERDHINSLVHGLHLIRPEEHGRDTARRARGSGADSDGFRLR